MRLSLIGFVLAAGAVIFLFVTGRMDDTGSSLRENVFGSEEQTPAQASEQSKPTQAKPKPTPSKKFFKKTNDARLGN